MVFVYVENMLALLLLIGLWGTTLQRIFVEKKVDRYMILATLLMTVLCVSHFYTSMKYPL